MAKKRVVVEGGTAMLEGENVSWDEQVLEVTVPRSNNRADRVYVAADGTVDYEKGTPVDAAEVPEPPAAPQASIELGDVWHLSGDGPSRQPRVGRGR